MTKERSPQGRDCAGRHVGLGDGDGAGSCASKCHRLIGAGGGPRGTFEMAEMTCHHPA